MSRYRGRLELLLEELAALEPGARPEVELAREVLGALRERYQPAEAQAPAPDEEPEAPAAGPRGRGRRR
jgi:hypothetical protein